MRPAPDGAAIPVGDDDVAGAAMPWQVPDAVPAIPPPSKSPVEPVLGETPDKLPAIESMREHVEMELSVAGPAGDVPEMVGLTPNDPCSVVPSGIPVGGTAGATPIPSGEVMPSGDGPLAPVWASAEPHRKSPAITPINTRVSCELIGIGSPLLLGHIGWTFSAGPFSPFLSGSRISVT
jgi:hypothetical protein